MTEHYFTAEPAAADDRRTKEMTLAGHTVSMQVSSGVFSQGGLDKGTRVLLANVPAPPPTGTFLDLGCGWGPLAVALGLSAPQASVWAVDVNDRALDLTTRNANLNGAKNVRAARPEEVPPEMSFDLIWSNPPIRVGKDAVHDILNRWLARLAPGGQAWLVVAKNLGADSLKRWLEESFPSYAITRPATAGGFRVLQVHRPSDSSNPATGG